MPCLPEQLRCLDAAKTALFHGLCGELVSPVELAQCLVATIKLWLMANSREGSPA